MSSQKIPFFLFFCKIVLTFFDSATSNEEVKSFYFQDHSFWDESILYGSDLQDWFVYYFGDLFLSLRNLLILSREICFFSRKIFLSSWGQYFVLGKEIRLFSFFPMEGDSDTGLVRVLFQVESFSSYWETFVSQKDDKIILAKCSEFDEWGERSLPILVSWPRGDFLKIL